MATTPTGSPRAGSAREHFDASSEERGPGALQQFMEQVASKLRAFIAVNPQGDISNGQREMNLYEGRQAPPSSPPTEIEKLEALMGEIHLG